MSQSEEQVLVIPTDVLKSVGLFQGFKADAETYLPELLAEQHLQFLPRTSAETDPSYKQIIPYAVFRCDGEIFHYLRGSGGGEKRLRTLRSIGIGGHISREDVAGGDDLYLTGLMREISEEVDLQCPYKECCVGLINDDSTAVGQVHLGIVHIFDLEKPHLPTKEDVLVDGKFSSLADLQSSCNEFETWSQLLLEADIF